MKLLSFCLLTTLALLYAGLTVAETMTYRKWERAVSEQKDVQAKVAYFQNMEEVTHSLIRRMAYDSQHDPALLQLLKEKRIKVIVNGADTTSDDASGNAAPSSNATPPASPNPAPADATPSHP